MNALMFQSKASLFIDTQDNELREENEAKIKNLFKVCCAIQNLKTK